MPKHLDSRGKQLVAALINYFEQERNNGGPLLPLSAVRERVAGALQISISTVSAISQAVKNNEVLRSPKRRRAQAKRVTNTAILDVTAIRNTVYEMLENREHATLATLHKKLQARELFSGCQKSLHTLLLDIGFKWSKENPRKGLMELPDIAYKRIEFLKSYVEIKATALFKFVFINETWIFYNGSVGRSWQDQNRQSVKTTKANGNGYMVLHAGNDNGFIPGVLFSSKTKLNDYNEEINHQDFIRWFESELLPSLREPSVIILDNAHYQNTLITKVPNSLWTKTAIHEWLHGQQIEFSADLFKPELLKIVAEKKPPKVYFIDKMARQFGHRVLRLPPYHCMFNAFESVRDIGKNYYYAQIGRDGKTLEANLNMWHEALATVTPEMWKNCIRNTDSEIEKWYNRERIMDREEISPIIINSVEDDTEDSHSDSDH